MFKVLKMAHDKANDFTSVEKHQHVVVTLYNFDNKYIYIEQSIVSFIKFKVVFIVEKKSCLFLFLFMFKNIYF